MRLSNGYSKLLNLNEVNEIKKIDKSGMLSFCIEAPRHYEQAYRLSQKLEVVYPKPEAIIVTGMGGSAIGGEILKDWGWDTIEVPIDVCRGYSLPAYANNKTLVFAVSYSGETEETLSAFLNAVKKKCRVVCIGSGGTLISFAEKMGIPHIKIPSEIPPRAALPYLLTPMLTYVVKIGLASNIDLELNEAIEVMRKICEENMPEKPVEECFSKKLAVELYGKVPVFYGFGYYRSVAQRLKQQFNENSKVPSKWDVFPELDHNEVVGWEGMEFDRFSAVIIRDSEEPEEIRYRIEATKEIIADKLGGIHEIWSRGKCRLTKMLSTIIIGDFTSVYLAILRGIDPTPVETIERLKEKMASTGIKNRIIQKLNEST
ncbi:MAG: bifunctional phosphoglucose/phosphomannose isomerase [Candidatus Bathyarchaeia archaeon]